MEFPTANELAHLCMSNIFCNGPISETIYEIVDDSLRSSTTYVTN